MRLSESRLRQIIREELANEGIWDSIKGAASSVVKSLTGNDPQEFDRKRFPHLSPDALFRAYIVRTLEMDGTYTKPSPGRLQRLGISLKPMPDQTSVATKGAQTAAEVDGIKVVDRWTWNENVKDFVETGLANIYKKTADIALTRKEAPKRYAQLHDKLNAEKRQELERRSKWFWDDHEQATASKREKAAALQLHNDKLDRMSKERDANSFVSVRPNDYWGPDNTNRPAGYYSHRTKN